MPAWVQQTCRGGRSCVTMETTVEMEADAAMVTYANCGLRCSSWAQLVMCATDVRQNDQQMISPLRLRRYG